MLFDWMEWEGSATPVLPAALLALCLPLAPALVSDDESWVSKAVADELAGEAQSSSGDIPRVTDISRRCSKVSEARMGPGGERWHRSPKGSARRQR